MDFPTLLDRLAQRLGLPSLRPDLDGRCGLCFDEDLLVDLYHTPAEGLLGLAAQVGVPHDEDRAQVLRAMLAANLHPVGQGDLYFALRPDSQAITLCRTLDTQGLDADGLWGVLEQLVTRSRACRQSIFFQGSIS